LFAAAGTSAAATPKNKHATKHFHAATKHNPLSVQEQSGENWMWCYVDEVMFEED